jgi:hypothetical protein
VLKKIEKIGGNVVGKTYQLIPLMPPSVAVRQYL